MFEPDVTTSKLAVTWKVKGMVPGSFALRNSETVAALQQDLPMYLTEIERMRAQSLFRVPYLLTPSIINAANDRAILEVVRAVLETDDIVMWGPNLQTGTPNEAGMWHTDIESWLWPTATVAVGLAGCRQENATHCIPGSQNFEYQPWAVPPWDNTSSEKVLQGAKSLDESCDQIVSFDGFANGRFYVFDAKCWHAGAESKSVGRELLFLHYSKADDPRIPYMKDYEKKTWFDFPATWVRIGDVRVNETLYSVEGKNYRGPATRGERLVSYIIPTKSSV